MLKGRVGPSTVITELRLYSSSFLRQCACAATRSARIASAPSMSVLPALWPDFRQYAEAATAPTRRQVVPGRCVTNTFLRRCGAVREMRVGSLDAGGQAQASNHCKLRSSKAMVVSVAAKGGTRARQV